MKPFHKVGDGVSKHHFRGGVNPPRENNGHGSMPKPCRPLAGRFQKGRMKVAGVGSTVWPSSSQGDLNYGPLFSLLLRTV